MKYAVLSQHSPELLEEWDHEENPPMVPDGLSAGSGKRVKWICKLNKDHRWVTSVRNRAIHNTRCPYCFKRKAIPANCLLFSHPEIAAQWHPTLNELKPDFVSGGSLEKIWWQCEKSKDHLWKASVVDRTRGKSVCPGCSGKQVSITNSLQSLFPDIAAEWDFEKNVYTPDNIQAKAKRSVWWKCLQNGSHSWKTRIDNRTTNNTKCPYCFASHGEGAVAKILQDLGVSFAKGYKFKDCKFKQILRFDFAVFFGGKIGIIEFHGKQHYESIPFFGGDEAFEKIKHRDNIKKNYCNFHGIPFVEIKFDEKELQKVVKMFCEKVKIQSHSLEI